MLIFCLHFFGEILPLSALFYLQTTAYRQTVDESASSRGTMFDEDEGDF